MTAATSVQPPGASWTNPWNNPKLAEANLRDWQRRHCEHSEAVAARY